MTLYSSAGERGRRHAPGDRSPIAGLCSSIVALVRQGDKWDGPPVSVRASRTSWKQIGLTPSSNNTLRRSVSTREAMSEAMRHPGEHPQT